MRDPATIDLPLPKHGGNVYYYAKRLGPSPFDIIDLSSSVNPLSSSYLRDKNIDLWEYIS